VNESGSEEGGNCEAGAAFNSGGSPAGGTFGEGDEQPMGIKTAMPSKA